MLMYGDPLKFDTAVLVIVFLLFIPMVGAPPADINLTRPIFETGPITLGSSLTLIYLVICFIRIWTCSLAVEISFYLDRYLSNWFINTFFSSLLWGDTDFVKFPSIFDSRWDSGLNYCIAFFLFSLVTKLELPPTSVIAAVEFSPTDAPTEISIGA